MAKIDPIGSFIGNLQSVLFKVKYWLGTHVATLVDRSAAISFCTSQTTIVNDIEQGTCNVDFFLTFNSRTVPIMRLFVSTKVMRCNDLMEQL